MGLSVFCKYNRVHKLFLLTTKLTCCYDAQRKSGQVQRFVSFCYYVPPLLLLFLGRVLLQDTGEHQGPHLTGIVYRSQIPLYRLQGALS